MALPKVVASEKEAPTLRDLPTDLWVRDAAGSAIHPRRGESVVARLEPNPLRALRARRSAPGSLRIPTRPGVIP